MAAELTHSKFNHLLGEPFYANMSIYFSTAYFHVSCFHIVEWPVNIKAVQISESNFLEL